jgi:hypothetical protein
LRFGIQLLKKRSFATAGQGYRERTQGASAKLRYAPATRDCPAITNRV